MVIHRESSGSVSFAWETKCSTVVRYLSDGSGSQVTSYSTLWILLIGLVVLYTSYDSLKPPLRFIWHCFLRPLGKSQNQQDRLDQVRSPQCHRYVLYESRASFTKAKLKSTIRQDIDFYVVAKQCFNLLHLTSESARATSRWCGSISAEEQVGTT